MGFNVCINCLVVSDTTDNDNGFTQTCSVCKGEEQVIPCNERCKYRAGYSTHSATMCGICEDEEFFVAGDCIEENYHKSVDTNSVHYALAYPSLFIDDDLDIPF